MSEFIGFVIGILIILVIPLLLVALMARAIMKKPCKKTLQSLCICFGAIIPLTIIGVLTDPATWCEHEYSLISEVSPTCSEKGKIVHVCGKCEREKTDKIDKLEHDMHPVENGFKCGVCGYEEITKQETPEPKEIVKEEVVEKVEDVVNETPTPFVEKKEEVEETKKSKPTYIEGVTYDEIYRAYKENELRADDEYQNNRYRVTAKVNGIENDGLLNLTGGATLTMEKRVGKTIVFFLAEFDRHQESDLKEINVSDTITFEGECLSAGSWTDCKIVKE